MHQKGEKAIETIELEGPLWEKDLLKFKHSLFHTVEWVSAMADIRSIPVFINFMDGDAVVGKISGLIHKKGLLTGDLLYCYASPAIRYDDQKLFDSCHDALLKFALKKQISRIIVGSYDQKSLLRCQSRNFYVTSRYEYVVPLSGERIHLSQNLKRNIKKAEINRGLFLEETSVDSLDQLITLIYATREKRKGKYEQDYNPFYLFNMNSDSIKRLIMTGMAHIYRVQDETGRLFCAILNLEKNQQSFNLLAGSNPESYTKGFSSFVDYKAIQRYRAHKFSYYNLGGGTGDKGSEGLERNKMGKGGLRHDLHGATTNYLLFPARFINPLLWVGRKLPGNNAIVVFLKQFFWRH